MTNKLFEMQDRVCHKVFQGLAPLLPGCHIILGGGTALARFYLQHRISYDLDFFLSGFFDPIVLHRRLTEMGLAVEITGIENRSAYAAQLHGTVFMSAGEEIRVSFVQDVFAGMFKSIEINGIRTEVIDGLYHRKLRTVSGTGAIISPTGHALGQGQRQTARDLFDLFVLDRQQEPIDRFIARINKSGAGFPVDIFRQNMAALPWLDMIDECEILEVLPPHEKIGALDLKRYFDDVLTRLMPCNNSSHKRQV